MENENLKCFLCKKQDETVHERYCIFEYEMHNEKKVVEIICDECENEHAEDI